MEWEKNPRAIDPNCDSPIWSPLTDAALLEETLEVLERHNVIGVTRGPLTDQWHAAAPDRIIPSLMFSAAPGSAPDTDSIRTWVRSGRFSVLGEVLNQYAGITPGDELMAPYWALAEELDVPVGIHLGPGPPGTPYLGFSEYRARLHSPLLMEEVLLSHPDLRVYLQHAGWPIIDDLLAEAAEATEELTAVCPSHDDYVWELGASSDPSLETGPSGVAMSTYMVCDFNEEDRADRIVENVFADIYNKHVEEGTITSAGSGKSYPFAPIPDFMMNLIKAGGLIPWLQEEVGSQKGQ